MEPAFQSLVQGFVEPELKGGKASAVRITAPATGNTLTFTRSDKGLDVATVVRTPLTSPLQSLLFGQRTVTRFVDHSMVSHKVQVERDEASGQMVQMEFWRAANVPVNSKVSQELLKSVQSAAALVLQPSGTFRVDVFS